MMGQGGQPINPYNPGVSYAALMGAYGAQQQQQQQNAAGGGGQAGRSLYGYSQPPQHQLTAAAAGMNQAAVAAAAAAAAAAGATFGNPYQQQQQSRTSSLPVHPDVRLIKLPFYDVQAELLKPASLLSQGGNRFHEAQFQFFLTPGQATDIASNRDIQVGSRMDYPYQIQLRFCPLSLEPNKEMSDEFPPNLNVHLNGKMVPLPNPVPTNKPGVEPKRPPRPVNITPQCKLSPILPNTIGVKWAAEYGKGWVVAISLVVKLTSDDLLDRLKKKETREADFTKNLIVDKLNDDEDEDVATTSLKVSITCPLGKMRMRVACRPVTCNHLQCFDAGTFLQMNERKPTWNCPVCDGKALYDDLLLDGYFQEILDSKDTTDETEVILERDGTWKLVPKVDEGEGDKKAAAANGGSVDVVESAGDAAADCIVLSDDDDDDQAFAPPPPPPERPPLPPSPTPPPPPPPPEIECIDLD